MPSSPRSARHKKIEPLSWEDSAQSPALKGMVSFLDLSPEDVRNGKFENFGRDHIKVTVRVPSAAPNTTPGDETCPAPATTPVPVWPSNDGVHDRSSNITPISPKSTRTPSPKAIAATEQLQDDVAVRKPTPGPRRSPGNYLSPHTVPSPVPVSAPVYTIGPEHVSSPGLITSTLYSLVKVSAQHVIPGRGRSKVRRAVLAQDGHSLGEEAIYQVLWRGGRPENGDPNCSRTIRIGAADIGYKVNMAKKNVRQNISRLFEKLALEIMEEFETMSSQARLYRVYSYKQILDRRRAAGLEFILRNKGVVFCTRDGEEIVSSPAYVVAPGDETSIRPAPPKKRRVRQSAAPTPFHQPLPPAMPQEESEDADLQAVSQALNRYWPVDQPAAVQLIRDCRRVRSDAGADEIAFFVREKLDLARQNRNITNPTGLILATVPQSFVGSTFLEFRRRMERQAALEAEEAARKEQERAGWVEWLNKDREQYETIVGDPQQPQSVRDDAEKKLRQIASCNPVDHDPLV